MAMIFDEKSPYWERNFEFNKAFIESQLMYVRDAYFVRGYVYLEYIYRIFGIKWDPNNENTCWIFNRDGELKISINYSDQRKIIIDILCPTK